MAFLEKIFGNYSDKEIKRVMPLVRKIEALEPSMQALTDEQLKGKTKEFKSRLSGGETLDDILPEAYAAVREAGVRAVGMRWFECQIIGGIILHQGRLAELKTGEGKTMVCTMPLYLNALEGKGAHLVTVNDYLASYQSEWMGRVYGFLGMTTGVILHDKTNDERRDAYGCDITYATNNELGFDYLRDNMVVYKEQMVQRGLHYAIIDEADSILVDEARTPLIISGMGGKSNKLYQEADNFVKNLKKGHILDYVSQGTGTFAVEDYDKAIKIKTDWAKKTDRIVRAELYYAEGARPPVLGDNSGYTTVRVYKKDLENSDGITLKGLPAGEYAYAVYACVDTMGEVNTNVLRAQFGSSLEEGDFVLDEKQKGVTLTQEGVKKAERYFGLENLSDPENLEYQHHINNALKANFGMHIDKDYVVQEDEVVIVDEFTGRLMPGRRYSDGLHQAIEAKEKVKVKRESKTLATITFQNFFNKYNKKAGMTGTAQTEEAEFRQIYGMDVVVVPTNKPVIRKDHSDLVYKSEAGKFRAVINDIIESNKKGQPVLVGTVSIEVSERLSDMLKKHGVRHQVLNAKYHAIEAEIVAKAGERDAVTIATNMAGRGTDIKLGEGVVELGGLKIIGTERHEARRIDNQLRGRSGRQGDPGESRFYISMEDDLLRIFGSDRMKGLINVGMSEDEPIESKMITRAIENAQKKVEGNNFGIRKHLLDYDRVANEQREIIYGERMKVLQGEDLRENIMNMLKQVLNRAVDQYTGESERSEWDIGGLNEHLMLIYHKPALVLDEDEIETVTKDELKERLYDDAAAIYAAKEAEISPEIMREAERSTLLRVIDMKWMDHIDDMDQMRQGVGLRAYAQKDPLVEYKFLSYDMFDDLGNNIQLDTVRALFNVRLAVQPEREQVVKDKDMFTNADDSLAKEPKKRKEAKVGRNDPCPCGSGKKYKYCCGKAGA